MIEIDGLIKDDWISVNGLPDLIKICKVKIEIKA